MSANQRANRVAFGNKYGKGRTTADSQISREAKRLAKIHKKRSK